MFVTFFKNVQNMGDEFVTSVKSLQTILIGWPVVMCL